MKPTVERMITDFEEGKITRRQLVFALSAMAISAEAAPRATELRAVSINHVTLRVPDLHRTSQFYQEFFGMPLAQSSATVHILAVGDGFFGIEQGNQAPAVDHYDFGIEGFDADDVVAKLKARGLSPIGTGKESLKFRDPDGFLVQLNTKAYKGHVS
jgi:catechol 2,3-dioxygenase-like lactoylglutathione lyase family enzyme